VIFTYVLTIYLRLPPYHSSSSQVELLNASFPMEISANGKMAMERLKSQESE
jgi:hypothetical protein